VLGYTADRADPEDYARELSGESKEVAIASVSIFFQIGP